jgi:UDP-2-acetamido-3-amino-2,3-dideoxy-glucuronate N-acetyltransferase
MSGWINNSGGSADIDERATLGNGTHVWHLAQIREHVSIGRNCVIGRSAYIGPGVVMGDNCKVQNFALVYDPAIVGSGVFIGPAAVLTNDVYPRAVNPDGSLKSADGWEAVGVTVGDGAAIGARSVIRAGVTIGAWALIGAGAVVVKDVEPYSMVLGNPAKHVAWVGRAGVRLVHSGDNLVCPKTGERYLLTGDHLRFLD